MSHLSRRAALRTLFFLAAAAARTADAKGLIVHEWGTFTTVSASDGRPLGGLYVDASRLPAFVQGVPFFNYDPSAGWAPLSRLRHVTVKMETPVLYFYSPAETDVEVQVRFQGGSISQWYPRASAYETDPPGPFVDFAERPYAGHIAWKAHVLAPGDQPAYTTAGSGLETAEWTAPRAVASNMLRGEGGEYERFLFYRGLGNFPSAVKLAFRDDSTLRVANDGDEDLPWLMVYDRVHPEDYMPATILWQGPLAAHASVSIPRPAAAPLSDYSQGMQAMDTLQSHLVQAGLYADEAKALVNTWYDGYFHERGLKAFWILPRAMVDRILPLSVSPAPDLIQRVIVGRTEILPPPFERELRQALSADTLSRFTGDKYYLAYQDLLFPDGASGATSLRPPLRSATNVPAGLQRASSARLRFGWNGSRSYDALGRGLP